MATETSTIRVIADTAQAERALGNLHSQLAGIGKIVVGAAIVHQFNKIAEGIDAINKSAQKFGISSAAMDALGQSAQLAGIDFGELTAGLQKFQQNLGDALIKNTGPAAAGLAMLGLKAGELANLPINEQLLKINESLSGIENPALKAAIAVDILGKQGAKLLKAADEAQRLEQRFKNLGLALTDVDTQGVENALDRVTEVIQVVEQGFKKLVANIAPYVDAAAQAILFIVDNFGGPIVAALGAATRAAIAFLAVLAVGKTVAAVNSIVTGFVNLQKAIKGAATAQAAFNVIVGANPIIRIATIVAGIAAVFGGPLLDAASKLLGVEEETAKQVEERKKAAEGDAEAAAKKLRIQQLILDLDENIVPQIKEQVRLQTVKNTLGDAAYETEKLIGEQAKKYNISLEEARGLVGDRVATEERSLQIQQKIASLAGQFKSPLSGAAQDMRDAQQAMEEAQKASPDGSVPLNSNITKGFLMAQSNLQKEILSLTDKAAAEEFAIREKYGMMEIDLATGYAENKEALEARGFDLAQARRTLDYNREYEFYTLRRKLQEDYTVQYGNDLAMMKEMNDDYYAATILGSAKVQEAARKQAEFERSTTAEKTQWTIEQGAQMFSALGAQNKKAFEAAKAFNIANAIMNTFMGVTKALSMYPWPFNLVAAGATLAMGMAQVNQIRSQSYSGRALGGPVMGGQSYIVGENGPELFTPNTTGSITRNGDLQGGGVTNINFNIQANDSQGFDDLLVQRRGMITQFVKDAMTEQGQRSKM